MQATGKSQMSDGQGNYKSNETSEDGYAASEHAYQQPLMSSVVKVRAVTDQRVIMPHL